LPYSSNCSPNEANERIVVVTIAVVDLVAVVRQERCEDDDTNDERPRLRTAADVNNMICARV
jgi:hypothetical protein